MGAGCVPVVFRGGGPLEIVEEGRTGYFFSSVKELLAATCSTPASCARIRPRRWSGAGRVAAAQRFSDTAFAERLTALAVNGL